MFGDYLCDQGNQTNDLSANTMENKKMLRVFMPLTIIFIITTAIFITARARLSSWNMDVDVLILGNIILMAATAVSFYFYTKALQNNNVQAFLRMVYSAMFVKMLTCIFAVVIYIVVAGKMVNKGAIFGCMFLYFLYTFTELAILMKLSKQNKNA